MTLGNKRPSQLVVEIKKRFADIGLTAQEDLIKSRLISAVPATVRTALVGHDDVSLEQFAKIADSMLSVVSNESPFIAHSYEEKRHWPNRQNHQPRHHQFTQSSEDQLQPQKRNFRNGVRPFYANQRARICNAHIYYAGDARTCRPWCKWPGQKGKIIPQNKDTPYQSRSSSPTNS